MAADMVVVVTTGFLIEEFLVNGKETSRVSIKSQKCTWNTTDSYLGMTHLYISLKFRIVSLAHIEHILYK